MTSFQAGRRAETVAADYLRRQGCDILAQNWRTRRCEIDIVARKLAVVYLCEVKYRVNAAQGTGVDYITAKKLGQMRFAAEMWVQANNWAGDYRLCVIELSGPDFRITNVIKDV